MVRWEARVWVLMMAGCGSSPPPVHDGALDATRSALLQRNFGALGETIRPLTAEAPNLSSGNAERWEVMREAAAQLQVATVPSTATGGYGQLIGTCAGCHESTDDSPIGLGHGAVFLALEQGIVAGDQDRRTAAAQQVGQLPELGASRLRLQQLSERIATSEDPSDQGRDFGRALQECLRCHGLRPDL